MKTALLTYAASLAAAPLFALGIVLTGYALGPLFAALANKAPMPLPYPRRQKLALFFITLLPVILAILPNSTQAAAVLAKQDPQAAPNNSVALWLIEYAKEETAAKKGGAR